MARTYLEFRGDGSSKFWEISVEGNRHTVRFGKIGTAGQSKTKTFKTPALAKQDAEALTRSKLDKGYVEANAEPTPSGRGDMAGRGRRALEAIFELEDVTEIRQAVAELVAAKPTATELTSYMATLWHVLDNAPAPLARAELLFDPALKVPAAVRPVWLSTTNNAISHAFPTKDERRSERWSDVVKPFARENQYLGHNLACAYVAIGRIDDAYEMVKVALDAGYGQAAQMRTDKDLGPLLRQARFQALFGASDDTSRKGVKARTSIPRNPAVEAEVARGTSPAKYAAWLTKEQCALGGVVEADVAADKNPRLNRTARARFAAYKKDVLDKAFPLLAPHIKHFRDGDYYFSFHYGFLEKLDTFPLNTAKEREEVLALLNDPHGMFVKNVTLRGVKLGDFSLYSRLPGVRRLEHRWTDITQVDSVEPLSKLTELCALDLRNSKVRDLRSLAKLPIVQLYLSKSAVVDLSPLAEHPTLSHIDLDDTKVTDVSPLLTCPNLCSVSLYRVKVGKPQVDELERYVKSAGNAPSTDDALMDGYRRQVFHGA